MAPTYTTTGINLRTAAMGENDRLVTILTVDRGLIRVVAPGAKKMKSTLRGRMELFVINELLVVSGKGLDRLIQADTIHSFRKLSKSLLKLATSQYLAELTIAMTTNGHEEAALYEILTHHLLRLEEAHPHPPINLYAHLTQAVYHLLMGHGILPNFHYCLLTEETIKGTLGQSQGRIGLSFLHGSIVNLNSPNFKQLLERSPEDTSPPFAIDRRLNPAELIILQALGQEELPNLFEPSEQFTLAWIRVEKLLRDYCQYYLHHQFKTGAMLDDLAPYDF